MHRHILLTLLLAVLATAAIAGTARADHPQPSADIGRMDYSPIGHFKPGQAVPPPNSHETTMAPLMDGLRFNPSGKYNAFDNNVFEITSLPFRAAGDESADDPYGNGGDPRHGYCQQPHDPIARPGNPALLPGVCPNHQLEYSRYYEATMKDILGDFGVSIRRYTFDNPGSDNTLSGRAINTAAVVPGADHPEETVIVGAHYDQTNDGPASAWDSQEGHAQIIRMAKIMADYWRSTGTRPAATVKFIPWDAEESGTLGSLDYATNVIVPGQEDEVRGYFNTDPCAGGYPAYRYGNPLDRIDLGIQIANPANVDVETSRIEAFNATATDIVEQVFERLDDTLTLDVGEREIFIATSEATAGKPADIGNDVVIGHNRPLLFSSDWRNFEVLGIPFFNPGPEVTGPDDEGNPNNPDGLAILHTPNDNQLTLNRMTAPGPSNADGGKFSEGWMKGMEMCAQLLSWGMLQPTQGGTQTATPEVVAYYEALPNEAVQNQKVTFDADGSYQYASLATRQRVDEGKLEYTWDFGDGQTGSGKRIDHRYGKVGRYESKLTVRNPDTGQTDTMSVPITVIASNFGGPFLEALEEEDEDGNLTLEYGFEPDREGFEKFLIEHARDFRDLERDTAEDDPAAKWTVGEPTHADIKPWQRSDSDSNKLRGNARAEGQTSYWTGVEATNFQQPPTVQQGRSELTLKSPVAVPAEGSPTLSYFSLFQNEGDDRGLVEVAVDDGNPATEPQWQKVDDIFAVNTAAGQQDQAICDPSNPSTYVEPLRERRADLSSFRGERILVRFALVLGPENRALSQPCGWYIDDIRVQSGTFSKIGETAPDVTSFEVTGLSKGTHSFRVKGLYSDGVETAPSNTESTRVTTGAAQPVGSEEADTCTPSRGFRSVRVRPEKRGLRFNFERTGDAPVQVAVFQNARGSKILGNRRVARFKNRRKSFTWNGRPTGTRRISNGYFFARLATRAPDGRADVRRVALRRKNGSFRVRKPFYRRDSCGALTSFKLSSTAFGGTHNRRLGIAFRVADESSVKVTVLRGRKVVRRYPERTRSAQLTHRLVLAPEGLRRGNYRVRIVVKSDGGRLKKRLVSRRV